MAPSRAFRERSVGGPVRDGARYRATVFNFRRTLASPFSSLGKILLNSMRSAVFLSAFPTLYMGGVCLVKSYLPWIPFHRFLFWLAGMLGSCSILIEKEHRRFELAMFALPRGVESAVNIMVDRGALPHVPFARVGFFAIAMGVIMAAFDTERDLLVPAMQSLLSSFFPTLPKKRKRKGNNNNKKMMKRLEGNSSVTPRIRGFSDESDTSVSAKRRPTSGLYKSTSMVRIAARPHEVLLQEVEDEEDEALHSGDGI